MHANAISQWQIDFNQAASSTEAPGPQYPEVFGGGHFVGPFRAQDCPELTTVDVVYH